MAELLKGAPVAAAITEELLPRVEVLKAKGIRPTLAIVRAGERPEDISYEKSAMKRCEKAGVAVRQFLLTEDCTAEEIKAVIREINEDDAIHGCLTFRPLKDKEAEEAACALLAPQKDVDGMTRGALASVFTGRGEGYPPCTAQACMELLAYNGIELSGKRVTVVGRSLVIGKPVSMLLQAKNATVTMCHSRTRDLADVCRGAEILIAAAGKAEMIGSSFLSAGQVIIDVGINESADGGLCGDVDFAAAEAKAAAVTPVPGGVGAITSAVLAKHVVEAAEKAAAEATGKTAEATAEKAAEKTQERNKR